MHIDPNELVLIYNEQSSKGKQTLAYALTVTSKVNKQEVNTVRVSSTLFEIMLAQLGVEGKDVINKAAPIYQETMRGKDMNHEEWFNILMKHPDLLRAPIAMYKGKVVLCNTPTDVLKVTTAKTEEGQ